ncbi:hypothetical protein [Streptomyces calidiresistens]|uniref:Uncharacterized protein n=1 Tax=Streptomyces calidiresistens TaxID=1485586 RepID=A0A7W3T3S5_9ACTN|nr:hypothetical protein [Streptomyces calidiresistens]MBB0230414.1 hypothetical protein [Streptomyces calidiresistens]
MPGSRAVTAAVVAVIALPLIWVGGLAPDGPPDPLGAGGAPQPVPVAEEAPVPEPGVRGTDPGSAAGPGYDPDPGSEADDRDRGAAGGLAPAGAPPGPRDGAEGPGGVGGVRCGPPVTAPVGVEARACVVTDREGTRARVSHRNDDGRPLRVELSLTRPDGQVVTRVCAFAEPHPTGWCETPAQPHAAVGSAGTAARSGWSATAELLPIDGEVPLLRARGADEP